MELRSVVGIGWLLASMLSMKAVHAADVAVEPGLHRSAVVDAAGQAREFSYFVPSSAPEKGMPLVIYLHGHGDNMRHIVGKGVVKSASAEWMRTAEREGFLVLYPLGLRGADGKSGWNDCRGAAVDNPQADDVEFTRQLIRFAREHFAADRSRVFVTGMSNGGHMTMRLAMEMPDQIAAAATIAALLPDKTICKPPSRPVPILLMHGTDDPIAPFEGGAMAGERGTMHSWAQTLELWRTWNGLQTVSERTRVLPDDDPSDDSRIVEHAWSNATNTSAVIGYEVRGGGHTEPSRVAKMNRLLTRIQGNQNRDVEMADLVWTFFRDYSLGR